MDSPIIPLEKASQILSVSIETLYEWNEHNILKPTITSTGQIGYRKEQIDQFLSIRQTPIETLQSLPVEPASLHKPPAPASVKKPHSISPVFALIASFVVTTSVSQVVITRFFSQDKPASDSVLSAQSSRAILTNAVSSPPPVPIKNTVDPDLLSQLDSSKFSYSQISNLPPGDSKAESVFDPGGNIKGEVSKQNSLASLFLSDNLIPGPKPASQIYDPTVFLAFFALCVLTLPLVFRKSFLGVSQKTFVADQDPKILELVQKADGAIVLCFQDREFKISRPELDSESDQFIDRLLSLTTTGTKEIDYDASKDNHFNLDAPLSKLVTRLGFVGLKRDLFFPRTSKNRVLFRKFITQTDLVAMNLSVDKISSELSSVAN